MKKLLLLATALILSFSGFSQTDEMSFSSNQSDLNNSSEDLSDGTNDNSDEVVLENKTEDNSIHEEEDDYSFGWSKGNSYISGSVGLWSSKQGDFKESSFNIMPSYGRLITDRFAIGGQVGYMKNKSEFDGDTTNESNTFMAGAYGKWLCNPEERFTPYVAVGANYVSTKYEIDDYKEDGFELGVGLGLVYGLSDRFYIGANYALASYSSIKGDFDGAEARNTFSIGLDWKQLNFALGYRLDVRSE